MEKYLKKIKPKYYWLVAFVLTTITYTMAFSYMGLLGNGTYVIARSDLKQQYIPFIQYFCSVLRGEHDYWYSWSLGMGAGTALLFAYYTLSPFNLIYLILGEDFVMTATAMVIVLKAATAAATYQIFVKNYLKKNYYETVIFSVMYALCGFQVCYYFNIMWMDAFYMLPVIALGIIKLLREQKWKLLLFSYAYVFGVNFYMGYIVGMSSFFLFLFAFFYNCRKRKLKQNAGIVFAYGSSVVSALFLTAIIWLPAVIQLFQNVNENYPSYSISKCNVMFVINNLFMGQLQTLRGITPFIYSGLLVVVLLPFFFMNRHIARKKKVYVALCMLWLICLFLIEPLNMMMHAFDKPGFFEQRFSFVFSFLLVTICCEQIMFLRQMNLKWIWCSILMASVVYFASYIMYNTQWVEEYNANTKVNLLINLCFFSGLIYIIKKVKNKRWDVATYRVVLTFFVMVELCCNAFICIERMEHKAMPREDYITWSEWEKNTYEKIKEEETLGFYRILSLNNRGQNQAFLYGHNAVEMFCSSEQKNVLDAMEKMGFYRGVHNLRGMGSTPIARTLFNVAYEVCGNIIVWGNEEEKTCLGYEKNEQVLSLGYMVDDEILDYTFEESPFVNQERLLSKMTGQEIDCYERIGMKMNTESGRYLKTDDRTFLLHRVGESEDAEFEFSAENDGRPLFIYLSQDRYVDITNGAEIPWIETKDVSELRENTIFPPDLVPARIIQVGTNELDEYSFSIILPKDLEADYFVKAFFCYYKADELKKAYEILSKQQWHITAYTDREIEGDIEVIDNGIMFTSIPYDEGWNVYVDGKKVEKIPLLEDAFIGVGLESGEHKVKMCYEPIGKREGEIVSGIIGLGILIVLGNSHILKKKKLAKSKENFKKV